MRIAIFHNIPGGGGYRVIAQLEEHLSKKHTVQTFSLSVKGEKNWQNKISKNKEIRYKVKPWNGFFKGLAWIALKLPEVHKRMADEINKYDFAIISHDYFTKSPYLLRYLKIGHMYLLHEPPREFYENFHLHAPKIKSKVANIFRYPLKYIDKKNVESAKTIIANSNYSKKRIFEIYQKESKVAYPGVDITKFKPLNKDRKDQILSIGGLKKLKGHEFVVEALKPILGKYRLIIIGGGDVEYEKKLRKILGNKSKYMDVCGHVSENEIINFYNESKVLCIGAYHEPFGLISIEAQATGLPVVAVNEGGLKENVYDGCTGFLTGRDLNEFKNKTIKAINMYEKLGKKGIKKIQNKWTWQDFFKLIEKKIDEN